VLHHVLRYVLHDRAKDALIAQGSAVGTKREGHGSLAGRRIVGRLYSKVQGPRGKMVVSEGE
jgi:hypothetical protein